MSNIIQRSVPSRSTITLADIPSQVGLFPLHGEFLLPKGHLPLHIYEERYITLLEDALKTDRLIGIIKPITLPILGEAPSFEQTGTLGRISSFEESNDGRFNITLTGICRFNLISKNKTKNDFYTGAINVFPYSHDLLESVATPLDREKLNDSLKDFFARHQLETDWQLLEKLDDETLLIALPMLLPLNADDKQELLEAPDLDERAQLLLNLLQK